MSCPTTCAISAPSKRPWSQDLETDPASAPCRCYYDQEVLITDRKLIAIHYLKYVLATATPCEKMTLAAIKHDQNR